MIGYYFGEDWDFGDEPFGAAHVAAELKSHLYLNLSIYNMAASQSNILTAY